MKFLSYFALLATAGTLVACAPATQRMPDHVSAPGHASGSAPPHLMNSLGGGGGPEVHRPEPVSIPGRTNMGGPTPRITGGGGGGGQEINHGNLPR